MRVNVRSWGIAFLLLCATVTAHAASDEAPKRITTVFLVRHADKNPNPAGGDAGLSAKGQIRAHELARVLGGTRLDAVYTTPFGRARLTAQAVADAEKDSVTVYDPEHPEWLAEDIRKGHTGGNVLVVGHGDTIPATYEALTGKHFPDEQNIPYDKLYVLILPGSGDPRLLTLRYGAVAE